MTNVYVQTHTKILIKQWKFKRNSQMIHIHKLLPVKRLTFCMNQHNVAVKRTGSCTTITVKTYVDS